MENKFITGVLVILIVGLIIIMGVFGVYVYNQIFIGEELVAESVNQVVIETKEDVSTPNIIESFLGSSEEQTNTIEYASAASEYNYFYDQLDNYSKIIYDGIEQNKDNMRSGTYTIEFGDAFSDLLNSENGQDSLSYYYQAAVEAYIYENPNVFYLDPSKMFLNLQTTTRGSNVTYNVYISNNNNESYLATGFENEEQVIQAQSQIEEVKNQVINSLSGNTYNKIKQIHDYLVDTIEYDQTVSKNNIYNLYGALINKEAVCEGYAKAYKYLLNEAGIKSVIVVGVGINQNNETENHAWNYVELNEVWYAVDTTWDDPIIQGGGNLTDEYKYRYFLVGYNTISVDHTESGKFTSDGKEFSYPSISNEDYNL